MIFSLRQVLGYVIKKLLVFERKSSGKQNSKTTYIERKPELIPSRNIIMQYSFIETQVPDVSCLKITLLL